MPTSRFVLTTLASACVLAASAAAAQTAGATQEAPARAPMTADSRFVHDAALGGMTEVKLGQLASAQGSTPAVKEFGQKMVEDHSKANDELAAIASGKHIAPPATLDAGHQQTVDRFGKMQGAEFDKAYWKAMLNDHKKTIALFQKESSAGKDADIRAFATKTLPTLKMHLQMVQNALSGNAAKAG